MSQTVAPRARSSSCTPSKIRARVRATRGVRLWLCRPCPTPFLASIGPSVASASRSTTTTRRYAFASAPAAISPVALAPSTTATSRPVIAASWSTSTVGRGAAHPEGQPLLTRCPSSAP